MSKSKPTRLIRFNKLISYSRPTEAVCLKIFKLIFHSHQILLKVIYVQLVVMFNMCFFSFSLFNIMILV